MYSKPNQCCAQRGT